MVKTYTSFARERELHKSRYYANAVLEVFLIFLAPCWFGFKFFTKGSVEISLKRPHNVWNQKKPLKALPFSNSLRSWSNLCWLFQRRLTKLRLLKMAKRTPSPKWIFWIIQILSQRCDTIFSDFLVFSSLATKICHYRLFLFGFATLFKAWKRSIRSCKRSCCCKGSKAKRWYYPISWKWCCRWFQNSNVCQYRYNTDRKRNFLS